MFKTKSLPHEIRHIVVNKGTEYPGSGEYEDNETPGTYLCRQCGLGLFRAEHKFPSGCGWPSFDLEIEGAVKRIPDKDGRRTEILCSRCDAHLGHVFKGEMMTYLNTRHCVNSLSIDWVSDTAVLDSEEIILAAGCFWGVEYYMQKYPGVLKTEVGYIGGLKDNPTYKEVCNKTTGHLEAVRVVFDPETVSTEQILKYFFEIHDQSQNNGQGPDLGPQYLSAIFYYTNEQQNTAGNVIELLKSNGYKVATSIREMSIFWKAETYHQDYYTQNNHSPYCHSWTKKF
jgi:peptide methionine sulfoxide reductase msrA/msrB